MWSASKACLKPSVYESTAFDTRDLNHKLLPKHIPGHKTTHTDNNAIPVSQRLLTPKQTRLTNTTAAAIQTKTFKNAMNKIAAIARRGTFLIPGNRRCERSACRINARGYHFGLVMSVGTSSVRTWTGGFGPESCPVSGVTTISGD